MMCLKRSTSLRLALLNSALLVTGFSVLLLGVTWLAERLMHAHVRESVAAELQLLEHEYAEHGTEGIRALIAGRLSYLSPDHLRVYRLEDPIGHLIIGNLDRWPDPGVAASEEFELPSLQARSGGRIFARWMHLGDSARLLIGLDELEIAEVKADLRRASLYGFVVLLLLSLSLGFIITRSAFRPVESIRLAAERILSGDLSHRVPMSHAGDDFDRLSQTLNAMLARIDYLVHSLRGATDNLAHDLLSPLTRHRARLEALLRPGPDLDALPQALEASLDDVDRVLKTCQSLLRIAKVETGLLRADFSRCDVGMLVADVAELMGSLAEERQQQLSSTVEPGPALWAHRDLLFQVLVNLLDNAIKFSPEGSVIELAARSRGPNWEFEVRDNGPGIPADLHVKVFERLVRLDSSRGTPGVGLGLAMVRACVDLHHGSIAVGEAEPGCRITVSVPNSVATHPG